MISLSNGHEFEYMTASGALGFDGEGWWWEKPLTAIGLMKLELFTIVLRTLTREPRLYPVSNLSWVRPWTWLPWSSRSCVQFLPNGGVVSKVGLWNPGIEVWMNEIAPQLSFHRLNVVASIWGTRVELGQMAVMLNRYPYLKAIEVNASCPNTGHQTDAIREVVDSVKDVDDLSIHPVILKLSVDQPYLAIAREVVGYVEALSLNSVLFRLALPDVPPEKSPVAKIGKPGTGFGGVSGNPAKAENWEAVRLLAKFGQIPVIAPSVMEYEDLAKVRRLGAKAISFGAIHCRTPCRATDIVLKDLAQRHGAGHPIEV